MINYVDDELYYSNNDKMKKDFEKRLSKKFHLSLMGDAKWYLGMRINQRGHYIPLDQDQYVKNITTRFEKSIQTSIQRKTFTTSY